MHIFLNISGRKGLVEEQRCETGIHACLRTARYSGFP